MTPAATVLIFRHPSEAEQREGFSLDCEITVANFASIVGPVQFTADTAVRCQIRQPEKAHRCGQIHWNGWVAANDKGEVGYIGSVCGDRDLKASERYGLEKRRVRAAIRLAEYLEILQNILADRPEYERQIHEVHAQLDDLYYRATGIKQSLPDQVIRSIREMTMTGATRVTLEYLQIKKGRYVEDGKEKEHVERTWTPHTVGTLRGLSIFDYPTIAGPRNMAKSIIACLPAVKLDGSAGVDKLKDWSETLGQLPLIQDATVRAEAALNDFTDIDNLRLLPLLVRNEALRAEAARYVLQRHTDEFVSKAAGRDFVRELDRELRSARKNDGMRIP